METKPLDAAAMMQAALAALAKGEPARAKDILERAAASHPNDVSLWLTLADARAAGADAAGQGAAIDRALSIEPNNLRALLAKGDYLDRAGDKAGASGFYAAALNYMPRYNQLPAHLQEGLRRAQAANARLVRELEDYVRAQVEPAAASAPQRFREALDILFGRKRVYVQEPRYLYYPGLPQIQFYEREQFPWLDAVEAATDAIRDELRGVIGGDFAPYVTQAANRPKQSQAGLADNPDWSALFLYKYGVETPNAAQCPCTMAALQTAPLTRIPNRAPSALFSKLAAGAHIPPHTGMLNARLIVHLPLIVPPGCEFRVGNDIRPWSEGKVWVFDDTIDHEAWNRGAADRYILLFDIWRPELSEEERASIAALCSAIDAFRGATPWDD